MKLIDKIIWKDGHITLINSEEAYRNQYKVITEDSIEYHLKIGNSELIWLANCWWEI